MKKTYKELFDNIHLDKSIDNKILNKTIYKKKNVVLKKIILPLTVILIIFIASFGMVYAGEIVEKIKNLFVRTTVYFDNGDYSINFDRIKVTNKKVLNYDAKFPNVKFPVIDNQQETTFEEIKSNLNIDILTPIIFNNKIARIIHLEKNDNKISHCGFVFDDVLNVENAYNQGEISMAIEFITKFYEKDYFKIMMGATLDENRVYKAVEINEKLNTEVHFWGTKAITNDDEIIGTLNAAFVYDDILYTFSGTRVSKNEMLYVINSLEYQTN